MESKLLHSEIIKSPHPKYSICLMDIDNAGQNPWFKGWAYRIGKEVKLVFNPQRDMNVIFMESDRYRRYFQMRERCGSLYMGMEAEITILDNAKRMFLSWLQEYTRLNLEKYRDFDMYVTQLMIAFAIMDWQGILNDLESVQQQIPGDNDIARFERFILSSITERVGAGDEDDYGDEEVFMELNDNYVGLSGIARFIMDSHMKLKYEWKYFMFVDHNHPAFKLHFNRDGIPITPGIFEYGALSFDPQFQEEDFKLFLTSPPIVSHELPPRNRRRMPFASWRKTDILKAIQKSGLIVPIKDGKYKTVGIPRSVAGVPIDETTVYGSFLPINLERMNEKLLLVDQGERDVWISREKLWMCTAVYRRIFGTLSAVNWSQALMKNLIGDKQLFELASSFGINTRGKSEVQVKGDLIRISNRRNKFTKDVAQLVPVQSQTVILQPDSPWVEPASIHMFKKVEDMKLTKPYEQFVAVRTMCENDDIDKEEMLKRIRTAGMKNLIRPDMDVDAMSKTEICNYLLEQIQYQADKYEHLFFDCNDPDIDLATIIGAIENMELQGALKGLDYRKLDKATVCKAVNNYLDLLMETKAMKIAK